MKEIDNNQNYNKKQKRCTNLVKKIFMSFFKGALILIIIMIVINFIYGLSVGFNMSNRDFSTLIINMWIGIIGSIILTIYVILDIIINKNKTGQETGKGCIVKIVLICIIGPIIVGLLVFGGCIFSQFFSTGFPN